jgi:uncharacterized membrane protein
MKSLTRVIRTTLVGGVLFLVPIIVLVLLVGKALQITHKLVAPLTAHLAAHSVLGIEAPRLAAICVLILVCFLAGVLARTTLASNTTSRMEDSVLAHLPGYDFLKSAVVRALTPESAPDRPIVLARVEDSWQIGALVERIDDGHVAVFVPGTPDVKSGAVYLMGNDRIRITNLSGMAAIKCVKRYGMGSAALLSGQLDYPAPDDSSRVPPHREV